MTSSVDPFALKERVFAPVLIVVSSGMSMQSLSRYGMHLQAAREYNSVVSDYQTQWISVSIGLFVILCLGDSLLSSIEA